MTTPDFDADFRARLLDLFIWRRDVRRFRSDPLPAGMLETLIGMADLSPSVGLSQPWRYVSVDDPGRRAAVCESFERANADALADYSGDRASLYARLKLAGLRECPAHLAVFCDESTLKGEGLGRKTMPEMLHYSVVAAISTFWLAARAHGIGVGWVSILEPDVVTDVLDVPPEWRLIGYLCAGYPLEESDKPALETAGWETRDPQPIVQR
ncbi:MAG: 5,6-dimethylbenzimidazole synthase [Alphaproteobacteria bacterium]